MRWRGEVIAAFTVCVTCAIRSVNVRLIASFLVVESKTILNFGLGAMLGLIYDTPVQPFIYIFVIKFE